LEEASDARGKLGPDADVGVASYLIAPAAAVRDGVSTVHLSEERDGPAKGEHDPCRRSALHPEGVFDLLLCLLWLSRRLGRAVCDLARAGGSGIGLRRARSPAPGLRLAGWLPQLAELGLHLVGEPRRVSVKI